MYTDKFYELAKKKLYPICRSITGNGTEKTLSLIKKQFKNLRINKISSGSKVFDWKVPLQWDIQDAYVIDKNKKKIIDFKKNNLHIVSYSYPVNKIIKLKYLLKKIHTLPKQPNAIPYVTSYYKKYWGFCETHNKVEEIKKKYDRNDNFKVVIKSRIFKGFLKYGELIIKGKSNQEILISTYICHPSMANNELSGPIVSMSLIKYFQKQKNLKTLRFIFIPETIGSIVYLKKNIKFLRKRIIGGYNLSCIGDERSHSCMLSKYGNTLSDTSLLEAYKIKKIKFKKYSFLERGSDERQYNSPGIDLPIASIFRTKYGKFKEYHTSLDDFKLVTKRGIRGGFAISKEAIKILQKKIIPISKYLCEPMLSKRKMYPKFSIPGKKEINQSYLDFLQYADGSNDLFKISKHIKKKYSEVKTIYNLLKKKKLIR